MFKMGPLYNLLLKNLILNVKHYTTVNTLRTSSIHSSLSSTIFVPFTAEIKILCHGFAEIPSRRFIISYLQLCYTLSRWHLSKPHMQLAPHQRTNLMLHHLLINCTLTVSFWTLFQDWWYQKRQ